MNKITLIISFLNEGVEVLNTLQSFRKSTNCSFDIILINDGSTDGFDYEQVANDFGAKYINHIERKGPAISRNEGVSICSTDYFLLIDAHMRVYQHNWLSRIIEELENEEQVLLCCSTLTLNSNAVLSEKYPVGYGAYVNLIDLSIYWIHRFEDRLKNCIEIPNVLGASYACSKKYWTYLDGLNSLKTYGFEEQLISLKVWLSGGKCKVLRDVALGHIFRDESNAPYEIPTADFYLNQLLIVELFYDDEYKRKFINSLRKRVGAEYVNNWMEDFKQSRKEVATQKAYYKTIFTRDFKFIIDLNTPKMEVISD